METELLQRMTPAPCSETVRGAVERACREIGVRPFALASGAAHDGMQLVDLCPRGMTFVRSRDGVSHNPDEWSSGEDCGAEVLYRVWSSTSPAETDAPRITQQDGNATHIVALADTTG